jgi:putative transposase
LGRKEGEQSHPIKWKAKYGGLEVSDAKRLKALEDENVKLKKLLAKAELLKEIAAKRIVTGAARREAVAHLRLAFEVSERRACSTLGADRPTMLRCGRACANGRHSPMVRVSAAACPAQTRRHHHKP